MPGRHFGIRCIGKLKDHKIILKEVSRYDPREQKQLSKAVILIYKVYMLRYKCYSVAELLSVKS